MGGLDGVGKAYSVEEPEVPGAGQVVDGFRVGLGGEGEDGLELFGFTVSEMCFATCREGPQVTYA